MAIESGPSRGSNIGEPTVPKKAVGAWVVYDVANTLFFTGMVGLLFPLWITGILGGNDASFGYTLSASMALVAVIAPLAGSLSDQIGRRKPFLAVCAALGAASMLLLTEGSLVLVLGVFAVGFIGVSTGTVFYNALLTEVSAPTNRGRISGLGIGIGYTGAIIAVGIGLVVVETLDYGYVTTFRIIAGLFILLSLPMLLVLKERKGTAVARSGDALHVETLRQLRTTVSRLRCLPRLALFLLARFWYMWAAHTAIVFAVLYATGSVGLSSRQTELILLVGIIVAIPSGIIWGRVVDRTGPRRSLLAVLSGWLAILIVAALIPLLDLPATLWWAFGILAGVLVAGVWATDRPYMMSLAPSESMGEFLGLHNMVGRLSAIVGPFSWGFLSNTLGLGQPAAVFGLTACVAVAMAVLMVPGGKNGTARSVT